MMQRLRDQIDSDDPTTARAAQLLVAVAPLDERRVRAWAGPVAVAEGSRRVAPLGRLRVAVVGAVTFASLAAAAASANRVGWFAIGHAPPAIDENPGSGKIAPPAKAAVRAASPVEAVSPAPAPMVPPVAASPDVTPAPRRASEAREPGAGATTSESVLIVQAVRALRRENDPARAQALAEESLRRYPRGAQVEEAMVLAMESAAARGDDAGARRAAARYLDRYPAGRFADRARRFAAGSRDGE
jgi:hypothetical protein